MNTQSSLKVAIITALFSVPFFAYAATDFGSLGTLVNNFTKNVVTSVGYLFLSVAVVVFFLGVIQFIWASRAGEKDGMGKGKNFMVWGLVALFVMFSVWGIIKFAQNVLGPEFQSTEITVPTLKFDGSESSNKSNPVNKESGSLLPNGSACTSASQCQSGACGVNGCTSAGY